VHCAEYESSKSHCNWQADRFAAPLTSVDNLAAAAAAAAAAKTGVVVNMARGFGWPYGV